MTPNFRGWWPLRRALIALLLIVLLLSPVAAETGLLSAQGSIVIYPGDTASGNLIITNNAPFTYSVVTYQTFWVEYMGRRVEGFNLTLYPRMQLNWASGQSRYFTYLITASENVEPGNYTLVLRFQALQSGGLYLITVSVPLRVLPTGVYFGEAYYYVPGRGEVPNVFLGERVVVYSWVTNRGRTNETVNVFAALLRGNETYSSHRENVTVPPGERAIIVTLDVGWNYPEGNYTLLYRLTSRNGEYTFTRNLTVTLGVRLVGASVERSYSVVGDGLRAYVTVLSERNIEGLLLYGEDLEKTLEVFLHEGTNVITLDLDTEEPGNYTLPVVLRVNNRSAGFDIIEYSVYNPPSIGDVEVSLEDGSVTFTVLLLNPLPEPVKGTLAYTVEANGTALINELSVLQLGPGKDVFSLSLTVPRGVEVLYRFELRALGRTSVREGTFLVPAPPVTPNTTQSPTQSPTNTTSGPQEDTSPPLWPVILVLLLVVGLLFLFRPRNKKRVKKGPRRRSPLGRFKRPRPPSFRERDSLPKR